MSTISSLLPQFIRTAKSALPAGTTDPNQQAWQRTIGDAGLNTALRVVSLFESGDASTPSEDGQMQDSSPSWVSNDNPPVEETTAFIAKVLARNNGGATPTAAAPTLPVSTINNPTNPLDGIVAVNVPELAASLITMDLDTEAALVSSPLTLVLTPDTWQSRNMVVLPADEGIEVWLRDANLTKSGIATWLTDLRNSMAALGASLARVSLNGKTVYWLGQGQPGQRNYSEA